MDIFRFNNTFIFKVENSIFELSDTVNLKLSFDERVAIEKITENYFTIRSANTVWIYNEKFEKENFIEFENINQIKDFKDKALLFTANEDSDWYLFLYYFEKRLFIWKQNEQDGLIYQFCFNSIIGYRKSIIVSHSLIDGNIVWQLDIRNLLGSENTQFFGDLIEYEGKLFFFLSDQNDKFGIYCIETVTGKVLNQTNEIGGFLKLSNGLLYMNAAYVVTTIHPDTFEIKQIDLRSVLEPKDLNLGIMMQINLMVGQLYYFVCQNGRSGATTVGIVNLEERSLVWTTEISIESGSYWIKEIQVHRNRLFVLTQGGRLHIFESE